MIIKRLEQLGLTEKEAKIYLALLEMGQATAQQLALKASINRATTYVILESLIDRGLATTITKDKKTLFVIESPLQILDILYKDKDEIENKIGIAKKVMPELEMLERLTRERAKVKFFEGRTGLEIIRKEIFKKKDTRLDTIFNINLVVKLFPPETKEDFRPKVFPKIKRSKAKSREIIVYDPKVPIPNLPFYGDEERRYIPIQSVPFNADFTIYGNKVALISIKENLIGLIIESEGLVNSFKFLFDLLWHCTAHFKSIPEIKNKKK